MTDKEKAKVKSDTKRIGLVILYTAFGLAVTAIIRGMFWQIVMPEMILNLLYALFSAGVILLLGRKFIADVMIKLVTW
jgi:hypothetical protein